VRRAGPLLLLLVAAALIGCGRYGPPVRRARIDAAPAAAASPEAPSPAAPPEAPPDPAP